MTDSFQHFEFNAAITKGDWSAVRIIGEKALAEGEYSEDVLYNLAVSYLKDSEYSMASAILLGLPDWKKQGLARDALIEALKGSGHNLADVNLAAHGMTGIAVEAAMAIPRSTAYTITAFALPVFVFLVVLKIRSQKKRQHFFSKWQKWIINVLLGMASLSFTLGALTIVLSIVYSGQWCGVIAKSGAQLKLSPAADVETKKSLNLGAPVFIYGDSTKAWLFALDPDGSSGWIDALQVRCIGEKH